MAVAVVERRPQCRGGPHAAVAVGGGSTVITLFNPKNVIFDFI